MSEILWRAKETEHHQWNLFLDGLNVYQLCLPDHYNAAVF